MLSAASRYAGRSVRRRAQGVAEVLANLQAKYHLGEPLWKQYLLYLNSLLHGDLGASFRYADWSVNELVLRALPVSLTIGGVSMVLAFVIGVCLAFSQRSIATAPPITC